MFKQGAMKALITKALLLLWLGSILISGSVGSLFLCNYLSTIQ